MSKQPRRAKIVNIPIKDIVMPWDMTLEECCSVIAMRIQDNIEATKHPYHHLTANGKIVDADITLDYLINRLKDNPQYAQFLEVTKGFAERVIADNPNAPRAVPVNRRFYGHDPYERH